MSDWISAETSKPSQGDRVLLAVKDEDCLVVGYWGCGRFEVCTVNHEVFCHEHICAGSIEARFDADDVTHWMPLPEPPKAP